MYPRPPISYSPYPQQNQGYQAVYYAQPVYQYQNYPPKIAQMSYTPEPTTMIAAPPNPPPVAAQLPPQPENIYMNYQQPQQPIIHQQTLPQQQIHQQHIHPQQIPPQPPRQYEISHQMSQIQQLPIAKPRPITEQFIGQQIKLKNRPIYQTQISPSPQIPPIPKQIIQPTPQRPQMQQIMIAQPHPIQPPIPRQYTPIPPKQPQIIQQTEPKQIEQPYKFKQDENNFSSNHKLSNFIQDNEPPGCFDIIGRGNLPSIYFNSEISFL